MNMPTSDQVNAGLRHVGTSAATAATVLGVLGFVPQDTVQELINDLHQITDGLTQAFGGFSKIVIILGPLAATWFGKAAVAAASLRRQLTAVASNPNVRIEGKIVAPAVIANAVPSDKVVAQ